MLPKEIERNNHREDIRTELERINLMVQNFVTAIRVLHLVPDFDQIILGRVFANEHPRFLPAASAPPFDARLAHRLRRRLEAKPANEDHPQCIRREGRLKLMFVRSFVTAQDHNNQLQVSGGVGASSGRVA